MVSCGEGREDELGMGRRCARTFTDTWEGKERVSWAGNGAERTEERLGNQLLGRGEIARGRKGNMVYSCEEHDARGKEGKVR